MALRHLSSSLCPASSVANTPGPCSQEDTPENEALRDAIAGKKAALEFTLRALEFIDSLDSSSDKVRS